MKLIYDHEGEIIGTENFGDNRTLLTLLMPASRAHAQLLR